MYIIFGAPLELLVTFLVSIYISFPSVSFSYLFYGCHLAPKVMADWKGGPNFLHFRCLRTFISVP